MNMEYLKKIEAGEAVYRYPRFDGTPGREIPVHDWGLDELINYCLYPIKDTIRVMMQADEKYYADVLERLYSSAFRKLMEMEEAIDKHVGHIVVIMENDHIGNGFLEQAFLDVRIEAARKEVHHAA